MKGLSVLFAMVLLAAAHLLSVQLRRARALPAQHPSHTAVAGRVMAGGAPRHVTPADTVLEL